MDTSKLSARYSKSDLLGLRYEGKSRQRPQCASRLELQTLGFWKINLSTAALTVSNTYCNQNKNRLSPEADNSTLVCSNSSSISSRRAMRNRERANNYYQRFVPTDSLLISGEEKDKDALSHGQPYKSTMIDHRSISSSHLMPAFAKKRFVISKGGNSADSNEGIVNTCASKGKAPSSPSRKGSELDTAGTCLNYAQPDQDQCLSSSPTFSTSRQERRIGSGRLLPRSDNWEYKNQNTMEASIENEKETSLNGSGGTSSFNQHNNSQHRSRTISGKSVERALDHTDRRFQYDSKKPADRQGINNRRISGKETFSNQSRGKRANSYLIHEEPEWFSAGPKSQLETIDLHGFDDLEINEERSEIGDQNDQIQQLSKNLATQATIDNASMRNSNVSSNLCDANPSDQMKDSGENVTFIQNSTDLGHHNKNQPSQMQSSQSSESEFNFDAFLNMHPLDNSLLNNEDTEKSEAKGTSRFSLWFRHKEAANNNELSGLRESHAQEKIGMPSVKDLEAQMTKVDMRTDLINPIAGSFSQTVQVEKPIARDTEAFKKLLQQLGSQARQPHPSFHSINLTNVATHEQLELKLHKKLNDGHSQQPELSVNVPTMPTSTHVFLQKRSEIQHLIQRLHCGDVSHEFLEKELDNPSTPAATKDVIATVFREYSHPKSNAVVTVDPNIFNQSSFLQPQSVHQHYSQELHSQNTANHTINQLISHGNSPTPLAFTPTSVLRKMTADKDTQSPSSYSQHPQYKIHQQHAKQLGTRENMHEPQLTATMAVQPRMILGGGNFAMVQNNQQLSPNLSQSRNQQVLKWTSGNMQMVQGKSFGRPILKGGLNSIPQPNSALPFNAHKIGMQPIHQPNQPNQHMQQQQQLRFISVEYVKTENVHQNMASPVGRHQLYLQHQQQHLQTRQQPRQRVIYEEMHRQSNLQMSPPLPGFSDSSDSGNVIKTNSLTSPSYQRDDRISSPTNQLAQWFSPELLAKASAGKLPLLNVNQALSLEEFERSIQHSSAVVHN
ncbi:protein cup [Drosophila erecta]|uniref:Protein cup n=1 Tax=Drosophila erecta TaxID=7220 RepID=B3P9Q6_DROER|nr:protein cup [Drosophila erecta]XP_026839056.1 protein cup [Drosophila erecta]EDV45219.1 uncharacterized protein Dere_GG16427 [Drosophila erecta]